MGIFFSRIIRDVPQLVELDEKRARRLLMLLERRHPSSLVAVAILVAALVSLNWLGACMLLREFQFAAVARGFDLGNRFVVTASIIGLVALMLPGPVVAMLVRDWWLRRLIHRCVLGGGCVLCSYPLASLDVVDGSVRCPECGTRHRALGGIMLPASILDHQPQRSADPAGTAGVSLIAG